MFRRDEGGDSQGLRPRPRLPKAPHRQKEQIVGEPPLTRKKKACPNPQVARLNQTVSNPRDSASQSEHIRFIGSWEKRGAKICRWESLWPCLFDAVMGDRPSGMNFHSTNGSPSYRLHSDVTAFLEEMMVIHKACAPASVSYKSSSAKRTNCL